MRIWWRRRGCGDRSLNYAAEEPDPRQRALEHLRTLAVFHYVLAGMTFLVASLFIVYLVTGELTMAQLTAGPTIALRRLRRALAMGRHCRNRGGLDRWPH